MARGEVAVGQREVKVKYIQSAEWGSWVPGQMARTCIVLERWMKGFAALGAGEVSFGDEGEGKGRGLSRYGRDLDAGDVFPVVGVVVRDDELRALGDVV